MADRYGLKPLHEIQAEWRRGLVTQGHAFLLLPPPLLRLVLGSPSSPFKYEPFQVSGCRGTDLRPELQQSPQLKSRISDANSADTLDLSNVGPSHAAST